VASASGRGCWSSADLNCRRWAGVMGSCLLAAVEAGPSYAVTGLSVSRCMGWTGCIVCGRWWGLFSLNPLMSGRPRSGLVGMNLWFICFFLPYTYIYIILYGRINIVKALAISRVSCIYSIWDTPRELVSQVNEIIYSYNCGNAKMWGEKKRKSDHRQKERKRKASLMWLTL